MRRTTLFYVVLFLATSTTAAAMPIINVGNHDFLPGEIRTITLSATGGDAVQGMNLYIQVDDGGVPNGGAATMPKITAVDIIGSGTLFDGNNTGQTDVFASDLLWAASVTTDSETVPASGTLALVTIDTAGTAPGEVYSLLLKETAVGIFGAPGVDTDFAGLPASITNGSLTIVPEPNTLSILLYSLPVLLPILGRWRQRKGAA